MHRHWNSQKTDNASKRDRGVRLYKKNNTGGMKQYHVR
jgi:hypothetical protein